MELKVLCILVIENVRESNFFNGEILQLNGIFCRELVPYDFALAYNITNYSPFVVHARRYCLNLNGEQLI